MSLGKHYKEKFRIWCSATDTYFDQSWLLSGQRIYEWTDVFTRGMKFPESELARLSSILDGTFVKSSVGTFQIEVVAAAILDTGESLRDFYLIPIEDGFGEVERLL